jgi:hypothetical protein
MPMRDELSIPAMRAVRPFQAAETVLPPVFGILRNPDLAAITAFATIGLLAAACLTLLFPLSDQMASFLAQVL